MCRLYDILHTPTSLTLVFEYAEKDLKAYMYAQKSLLTREPFVTKVRAAPELMHRSFIRHFFAAVHPPSCSLSNHQVCSCDCSLCSL